MDKATLKKSLCNCIDCENGKSLLVEDNNLGKKGKLSEVTICDIPIGALIVKDVDKAKFHKFLNENTLKCGYNKHSDYLIVTDDKIVFIELKSLTEVNQKLQDECWQKFTSDICMIRYVDNIFQKMLKKNCFFENKETHFVLLYQTLSMAKTPIVAGSLSSNLTPDTFRSIPIVNGGTISFNRTI